MSKKSKQWMEKVDEAMAIDKQEKPDPLPLHPRRPMPLPLEDIRNETLRTHTNTAHTIADLETWVAEIEATIAFLKARNR